ncbi:hypothetical protein [Pseudokineococcus sp. 1T1Z-3]|uniref:hypothetical protein n=1 Tax=Pseudokineococcus sp. 1T1Z-3 TaxID=3132745 RepID=UPI0030B465C6
MLALAKVRADVAPLGDRGCLVAAVGEDADAGGPADGDALARAVSRSLGAVPVLVLRSDAGPGGGSVRAERWRTGAREHGADVERSPGLVLAGLPTDAERVVHGRARVGDLEGATSSAGLGRLEAARRASAGGRGARRGAGGRGAGGLAAPRLPSPVLPAVLAVSGVLVLLLEVAQLLSGRGSALVAAVALLGVVLGTSVALRRRAARREEADDAG